LPQQNSVVNLFNSLRSKCNDQNPDDSGLITITAFSHSSYGFEAKRLLDDQPTTQWCSQDNPDQWFLFDLKGTRFLINTIVINCFNRNIPQHWKLYGSNDKTNWITIHD
jgi:hypothetical protein